MQHNDHKRPKQKSDHPQGNNESNRRTSISIKPSVRKQDEMIPKYEKQPPGNIAIIIIALNTAVTVNINSTRPSYNIMWAAMDDQRPGAIAMSAGAISARMVL